jgi:hypothetical protein
MGFTKDVNDAFTVTYTYFAGEPSDEPTNPTSRCCPHSLKLLKTLCPRCGILDFFAQRPLPIVKHFDDSSYYFFSNAITHLCWCDEPGPRAVCPLYFLRVGIVKTRKVSNIRYLHFKRRIRRNH